ncbi:MAG TPA: DUF2934 domain-containing protein [Candidatus Binataceae bacterium]|nr:DUF2934 domain-containing protein [Candidatus Binataceae bacterium]
MATTTRKTKVKAAVEKAREALDSESGSLSPEQSSKTRRASKAKPASVAEQPFEQVQPEALVVVATLEHTNGHSPTHADIELRAYEIFIARGATHGQDVEDWLKAEQEVRARNGAHS